MKCVLIIYIINYQEKNEDILEVCGITTYITFVCLFGNSYMNVYNNIFFFCIWCGEVVLFVAYRSP